MVESIDNQRVRNSISPSTTPNTSTGSNPGASATANKVQSSSADQVELQSTQLLQGLQQQAEQVPEVDQQRVDSIKQAIANGEYQPDPEKIAQQFTKLEQLFQ